jgi:cyclophilin family peptidyl-prolyl cis-trans isomerase
VKRVTSGLLTLLLFVVAACGDAAPTATPVPPPPPPTATTAPVSSGTTGGQTGTTGGPAHITVQHILIAFQGSLGPSKEIKRTKEEAKTLAYDVLAQAKGGADFDQLVQKYTDDQAPGIYKMSNTGVTPLSDDEYPCEGMVPAFGNVGFTLQPGGIGIADYDPTTSPFGWHIIKRLPMADPPTAVPASTGPLPKFMIVETAKGTIKIQLYTDPADGVENVVRNFADKARAGYFDGLVFHRVEDWVVQGGDPTGTGRGGQSIPSQYNQKPFKRGAVGVASTGASGPTINDSQWFVVKTDADYLNGQYTNFGQVVAGMDVVDKLAVGDKMTKVTVADQ